MVYVDSSLIVALMLGEKEAHGVQALLHASKTRLLSCLLLEAEVLAVAAREKLETSSVRGMLAGISLYTPDRTLYAEYETIFRHGYLRGADAYHLVCALFLDPGADELRFITLDKRQRDFARKVGFRTQFEPS